MVLIAIYSVATGEARRVIRETVRPLTAAQLAQNYVGRGEAWFELPANASFDQKDIQGYVNDVTGTVPEENRQVFVRNGLVVGAVAGFDAACGDVVPDGVTMHKHSRACPGWRHLGGRSFARPIADITADIADRQAARGRVRGARFDTADEATKATQEAAIDLEIAALIAERDQT